MWGLTEEEYLVRNALSRKVCVEGESWTAPLCAFRLY
jgi:hypothetical protein